MGAYFIDEDRRLAIRDEHNAQIGVVSADDIQNEAMYLCKVTIGEGENAAVLHVQVDTGSGDFWGTSNWDTS